MSKKLWKNYVKIGIFFVIAIISAVFLILVQQYDYPPIKSIRASCELSENWILTIEGKKEKKIIDLPYSTKKNTAENLITIENRLPETNFSDGYLRLGSSQQEIRVYLDGEKIDTFESMRKINHGKTGGASWIFIKLPQDYAGKTIKIEFISSYTNLSGRIGGVWIGSKGELIADVFLDSIGAFSIALSLFLLAIFVLVMNAKLKKLEAEFHGYYVALLLVFVGLWIFCQSQYQIFLFNNYAVCYFIEFSVLYLFPVLLNRYLQVGFNLHHEKILHFFQWFHLILALVFLTGQLIGWFTLYEVQDIFLGVFLITFLIDFMIVLKNRKKDTSLNICIVILGIMLFMSGLEIVLYDVWLPIAPFNFIEIGVILCEVYITYILIRQWFGSIKEGYQSIYLKMQLENQINHYKELEKRNQDLKGFRHDLKNHLEILNRLLERKETDLAIKYIADMRESMQNRGRQIIDTGNPIIDAVLSEKIHIAQEQGICVKDDIFISKGIRIDSLDGCVLFGNIMDNAIEACNKIPQGEEKKIQIKMISKTDMLICKFTNTINKKVLIDENLKTTKKNTEIHGIGVKNIRKTAEKYGGTVSFEKKEEEFEVSFVLFGV